MNKNRRLTHSFMIYMLFVSVTLIIVIDLINLILRFSSHKKEISQIKQEYISNQEYIISNEIERVFNYIQSHSLFSDHSSELLQSETLEWMSKIRFFNLGVEEGIFFVRNYDGILLMSVSVPEKIGQDTSGIVDQSGINLHDMFMDIVNDTGEGYADYSWYNPAEGAVSLKRSYIKAYPEWEWYIGAGFWFNDINKALELKETELKNETYLFILELVGFCILIALLGAIFIRQIYKKIEQNINDFLQFFEKAAHEPVKMDPSITHYEEFEILANSANEMIEARWKAENELRTSQQNLAVTLNSIGDGVIVTDEKGKILRMNPVAEQISGWKLSEAFHKDLPNVFNIINEETRKQAQNPVETVIREGRIVGLANHTLLIRKNGEEVCISDSAAPIRNATGELYGVVLVFRDVTGEKKMQDQLRQTQKLDSIGQLAGGIAHDFNNMLAGIMGYGELLQLRLENDPDGKRFVEEIIHTSERAAELTQKLLAFAHKSKAVSTPIDIHSVITDAISILERSIDRRIMIRKELNAELATVIGDPAQLQNDILNLGVNARDAMPNGGVLTISTQNIELDESYTTVSPFDIEPGMYIEISIRDTGMGMNKSIIEHIFEPFFTTKGVGKGTGLGLSAVYGSMKNHAGAITVYSEPNNGSVFHLYLPTDKSEIFIKPGADDYIPSGTGTILVVDDEKVIRSTATLMLQDLGYTVLTATDGKIGVDIYTEQKDQIDLVILDMIMPNMNGRDCFLTLKEINPNVKVIISSGFTRDNSLTDLKKLGLLGFIHKPFRRSELAKKVAEAMAL